MTQAQVLRAKLTTLFTDQARQFAAFVQLLEREQQALVAGDADSLIPLAQQKSEACAALARLDRGRDEALAAAGLGVGRSGVEAWLAAQPATAQKEWQALLDVARRAQELNRQNGELIKTRLTHNQQALAVLMAAADQAALYGPDGQAQGRPGSRVIGSA